MNKIHYFLMLMSLTVLVLIEACTESIFTDMFIKQHPSAMSTTSNLTTDPTSGTSIDQTNSSTLIDCSNDVLSPKVMCPDDTCIFEFPITEDDVTFLLSSYTVAFSEPVKNISLDTVHLINVPDSLTMDIEPINDIAYILHLHNYDPLLTYEIGFSDSITDLCDNPLSPTTIPVKFIDISTTDDFKVLSVNPVSNITRRDGTFMDFEFMLEGNSDVLPNLDLIRIYEKSGGTEVSKIIIPLGTNSFALRTLDLLKSETEYVIDFTNLSTYINPNSILVNWLYDYMAPKANQSSILILEGDVLQSVCASTDEVHLSWSSKTQYSSTWIAYWELENPKVLPYAYNVSNIPMETLFQYKAILNYPQDSNLAEMKFQEGINYYYYIISSDANGKLYESDIRTFQYTNSAIDTEVYGLIHPTIEYAYSTDPNDTIPYIFYIADFKSVNAQMKHYFCTRLADQTECADVNKLYMMETIGSLDHQIHVKVPLTAETKNNKYLVDVFYGDACGTTGSVMFNVDRVSPILSDYTLFDLTPTKTILKAELKPDSTDRSLMIHYGLDPTNLYTTMLFNKDIPETIPADSGMIRDDNIFLFTLTGLTPGTEYYFKFTDQFDNIAEIDPTSPHYQAGSTGTYSFLTAINDDSILSHMATDVGDATMILYDKNIPGGDGYQFANSYTSGWSYLGSAVTPIINSQFRPLAATLISGVPYVAYLTNNYDLSGAANDQQIAVVKYDGMAWIPVGTPFDLAIYNSPTPNFTNTFIHPQQNLSLGEFGGNPVVSFLETTNRPTVTQSVPITIKFDGSSWVKIPGYLGIDFVSPISGKEFLNTGSLPTTNANGVLSMVIHYASSGASGLYLYSCITAEWDMGIDIFSGTSLFPVYPFLSPYPDIKLIELENDLGTDVFYMLFSVKPSAGLSSYYVVSYNTFTDTRLELATLPTLNIDNLQITMRIFNGTPCIIWLEDYTNSQGIIVKGVRGAYYDSVGNSWTLLNAANTSLIQEDSLDKIPYLYLNKSILSN